MRRFVSFLLITGLGLLWASALPATDRYVPVPYATIQAAITAANSNDVIVVAAGIQFENNILVDKPLTIQGGGIGVSFIDASASTATGNVVKIDIASGDVLFDGFTIKTGKSLHGITASSTSSGSTITISHNRIEGYGPTATDEKNYGLIAGYGSLASLVFTYNEITNCGDNTILLERHVGPTDVSYNTFDRTAGDWSSDAYFNMNYGGTDITTLQKVSNNTIDMGAGTVFTNATRGVGISFTSSYTGVAGGFTNIQITDNVIKNLKTYRRGIMFWNNAPAGTSSGSVGDINAPVVARNTITNAPGYTGQYGIRLLGLVTNASVTNNSVEGVSYGFAGQPNNTNLPVGAVVTRNSFVNVSNFDWQGSGTADARYSWWGAASGPYHPTLNPTGTGTTVSDNVLFAPWMTALNQISVVPASGITKCGTPITYTFHIDRAGASQARGYDVKFDVDNAVVTVTNPTPTTPPAPPGDIVQLPYLSSVGGTSFFVIDNGGGTYTVSCAILGGSVGAIGNGDLFTVAFMPVAESVGTSPIAMVNLKLRDLNNQPLVVSGVGGTVQVDCTLPTMEPISYEIMCGDVRRIVKVAPVFTNFGFDDDVNLDLADYQIDALGWTSLFSGINATEWNNDGWTLPGFASLSQGAHMVYFRVKDDAGNWNAGTLSWAFEKDTVAPAAPTNFVALPGHNKVHLTWTNPTTDFAGVEIRRVAWGDYADYYAPPAPSYPATYGEYGVWTLVTQTSAAAYNDLVTPRDIYYYAAFAYDCAGNYSVVSSTARDRATSYWLGDISPALVGSGDIQIQDIALFSLTFGQIQGGPAWNEEGDFGPTDDYSRFGIPMPDNVVDFEDLMIFAMNYGNVLPSGTSGGLIALTGAVPLGEQVSFRLVLISREDGKATYAVMMENGSEILKGFSLKLAYGAGNALESVTSSRGLTGKGSEHFFGVIEQESGVVEICVAALGVNSPFEYTGEVARVVVRETTEGAVQLKTVDLRDINNGRDEVTLPGGGGETPFIPVTTALMQNHPNPFNPTTTITFDVAVAGDVRIEIYDVSGSLVRTLVSGSKGVGRHVTTWDGHDSNGSQVHTGVYFYRMTAPGYTSQAKKMLLLK